MSGSPWDTNSLLTEIAVKAVLSPIWVWFKIQDTAAALKDKLKKPAKSNDSPKQG